MAKDFVHDYGLEGLVELLVDDPALDGRDGFDAAYAAWPTRFYVVEDGRMKWIAQPDNHHEYDTALAELEGLASSLVSAARVQ